MESETYTERTKKQNYDRQEMDKDEMIEYTESMREKK
jgi:hypothetical protein